MVLSGVPHPRRVFLSEKHHMTCVSSPRALRGTADSFAIHSAPIHNGRLLSATEECSLAEAIALGDTQARDTLVRSNLGLVHTIARAYLGHGLELDDLVAEGNLGLIRAAEDFDPRFGVRFSTYAAHWIKQAIRHALTNTAATIRLPAYMVRLLSKWRKAERSLSRELGQTPTFEQIAMTLGLTEAQRGLVGHALRTCWVQGEGMRDDRAGDGQSGPDASVERAETADDLRARMAARLDAREREIITLRFGLEGGEPLTLKEVGCRLGFTREWVRKIELRAIAKLQVDDEVPA
jgi:RNA polymerase primary sigma factor